MATIRCSHGILSTSIELRSGMVVGRDARCDIAVNHPSVSRLHARFEGNGSMWWVINCSAMNPLQIQGTSILLEARLADGDAIVIGPATLRIMDGCEVDRSLLAQTVPLSPHGAHRAPLMTGLIGPTGMLGLLGIICGHSQIDGTLSLYSASDELVGQISLVKGSLRGAGCALLAGESALRYLASPQTQIVHYRMDQGTWLPISISRPTMGVLLDLARAFDEDTTNQRPSTIGMRALMDATPSVPRQML